VTEAPQKDDEDHVIKEVQDGEYIITTKQPYARAHFFIDEELDEHDETPNLPVG